MRMWPIAAAALAVCTAAGLVSCGTARRLDAPIALASASDPLLAHGREVFMRNCNQCHPRGEAGLGPALNNKYVPAFMIRTQVRLGLGAMPAFPTSVLSEQDLAALVRYIQFVQYQVPAPP